MLYLCGHSFVAQARPETTAMAIEEELVPSDVNEGEVRATAIEVEENEDDDADKTTGVLSEGEEMRQEQEKEEDRKEDEEYAEQQDYMGGLAGGNQEKEEVQEERQAEQTEEMTTDSGEHASEKPGNTEHERAPPTAPSLVQVKSLRRKQDSVHHMSSLDRWICFSIIASLNSVTKSLP